MKNIKVAVLLVLITTIIGLNVNAEASQLHTKEAEDLKVLGLFMGTENGFELEKVATRAESATMLVRLLGAENEAKESKYKHPFIDVPKWADEYIGFMYENGLTTGISDNKFGTSDIIDGKSYTTFVLRALGYDDSKGDFSWREALEFAEDINLIDTNELNSLKNKDFKRNELVLLSYNSLKTLLKDTDKSLFKELMYNGVIRPHIAYDIGLLEKDKYATIPLIIKDTPSGAVYDLLYSRVSGINIKDGHSIFTRGEWREPLKKEHLMKRLTISKYEDTIYKGILAERPDLFDPKFIQDITNEPIYRIKSHYSFIVFYDENIYPTHYIEIPKGLSIGAYNLPVLPIDKELDKILKDNIDKMEVFINEYIKKVGIIPKEAISIEIEKSTGKEISYAKINRELLPLAMRDFTDINTGGQRSPNIQEGLASEIKFVWDEYDGIFQSHNEDIENDRVEIRYDSYLAICLLSEKGELLGYTVLNLLE